MTKKDFILIARVIRESHQFYTDTANESGATMAESRDTFARQMADALSTTNPAFNRAVFLEACKK